MARKKPKHASAAKDVRSADSLPFDGRDLGILLALILSTLAVYAQVRGHQFIGLDDNQYLVENPIVARGLTFGGIAWAFTTFHAANWHPLTWLSHMLDCQLFGLNAGAHLLVNLAFHVGNTVLVFWFFRRVTGARWCSALVAGFFALHPLHVESVAWASERKDVLAAFFGLLALVAYARYAEKTSWPRYALVALCLALGLICKPMLVTWPFVLLLLDVWPLCRLRWPVDEGNSSSLRQAWPLLREKIPLLAIALASVFITFIAQTRGGAVRALADAPLGLRFANALVSYAKYFIASFWPLERGVYYPFPAGGYSLWQIAGAAALLAFITVGAVLAARRQPCWLVGWLWFLGTLVPVIGLVQVGGQAMADRYHYLPSIGLFAALVFGGAALVARSPRGPAWAAGVSVVLLALCAGLTARQVQRWRDGVSLFTYTLSVTTDNLLVEYNLGHALGQRGESEAALRHFKNALRLDPDLFDALINAGMTYNQMARPAEGLPYLERALRLFPNSSKAHTQRAIALAQLGEKAEALREFRRALELAPRDAEAHSNLGLILARQGELAAGTRHLLEAVRLNPRSAEAQNNLGLVLLAGGDARASLPHCEAALRLNPRLDSARENLRRAQAQAR